jgi:hypothetical protein
MDSKASLSVELEPVFHALQHNRHFRELSLSDIPRKELLSLVALVMQHNSTLTSLKINNPLEPALLHKEVLPAIACNPLHQLQILDLSRYLSSFYL